MFFSHGPGYFLSLTAMRIHISETTHSELLKAGIYHMSKRGEVEMKVNTTKPFGED